MRSHNRGRGCVRIARKLAAASATALLAWGTQARAANTYTWAGGASGDPNDFNNPNNWLLNGATPTIYPGTADGGASSDIAYFNNTAAQLNQPQLTASDTIGELDFNSSGWMLGSSNGATLTLNGSTGIYSAATSGINEISAPLTVGATQTWYANVGGMLQVDGVVGGSSALTIGAGGYFGTTLLTAANTYSGAAEVSYGTLELSGANGSLNNASKLVMNDGVLVLNNSNALSVGALTLQYGGAITLTAPTATISGGTISIVSNNNNLLEAAAGDTLTVSDALSGSGTLMLGGGAAYSGAVNLTGTSSFSGTLYVNSPNDLLSGSAGTLASVSTIFFNNKAALVVNNLNAAGGNVNNRINNNATFEFWGGSFVYGGADASSTNSSGAVGTTNIDGGPLNTISVNPAGGNTATFNLGSINRSTNGGVLFVNGANLGTGAAQLLSTNQPTLLGATNPTSSDNAGVYNTQIVPFMIGEASGSRTGNNAGGTATGTANTFVTSYYNSSLGAYSYRPLIPSDEFASYISDGSNNLPATTGDNIYLTSSQSAALSSNDSINSLVISGSGNAPVLTIPDGMTLTDSSGALLFATSGTVQPSSSTGTLDFSNNEGIVTVNRGVTGYISAPITTGANGLTVNGPGTLALITSKSNVSGSLNVNGTLQFGNGSSASADAMISNTSTAVNVNQGGTLNFNDVGAQTVSFPINFYNNNQFEPGGGNYYANYFQYTPLPFATATVLVSGPGALTFNNTFSASGSLSTTGLSAAELPPAILASQTLAPISITGNFNIPSNVNLEIYEGGTSLAGTPIGSNSSQTTWSVTGGGSINTSGNLYISNTNFGTGVTPAPVTFNVTSGGTISANGGLYIGQNGGAITFNVNGPVSAGSLVGADSFAVANNNSPIYSIINVSGNSANLTTSGNAFLAGIANQYQYLGVNNGGTMSVGAYFQPAIDGDLVMELGTPNGSPSITGNVSAGSGTYFGDPTGVSGATPNPKVVSVLNLFAGGTLTNTSGNGVNAGWVVGQTFTLNAYGGTMNNTSPGVATYIDQNLGAGFTAYSVVNLDSDASGNVGKMITGYIRALPNPSASPTPTAVGSTSAIVNFNGGELQYNTSGTQNTFINPGVDGGVFAFQNGAIIGTNGGTATIPHPLLAPTGSGVTSIPISNGGSGYLYPPAVVISDGSGDTSGIDATAFVTITNGVLTGITITSPGINYTVAPTVTLVGGDPTAPATLGTAGLAQNVTTGGLTKADSGTLILPGGYWYTNPGSTQKGSYTPANQLTTAQNTYGGATTVQAGTLEVETTYNATIAVIIQTTTSDNAAVLQINQQANPLNFTTSPAITLVNNNLPLATNIVVGDVAANTIVNGNTLTNVGTLQITATGTNGVSGFALANNQTLAGFGVVTGSSTEGLNIGQAPSGATVGTIASSANPVPGTPATTIANNPIGTNSVISPGSVTGGTARVLLTSSYNPNDPKYGEVVYGSAAGSPTGVTLNTRAGNQPSSIATGALTLGNGTSMTTSLGGAGTYYWKLDLSNGGAGATPTAGAVQVSPGQSANNPNTSNSVPAAGAAWDELIMDSLSTDSTASGTNAFTIQAVAFTSNITQTSFGGSAIPVSNNTMPANSYSWVIARINSVPPAGLLANLSLATTEMPKPATGYGYFLNLQPDPGFSGNTDLVVNYAPVPEPTTLCLLAPAAAALLLRRRRHL